MTTHNLLVSILLFTVLACARTPDSNGEAPVESAPPQSPAIENVAAAPSVAVSGDRIKGNVVRKMDAGSYTYVLVEIAQGQQVWAAGPQSEVEIGTAVDFEKGMEMKDFRSKSLGQTFSSIYFVSSFGLPKVARGQHTAPGGPTSRPARPTDGTGTSAVAPVKKAADGFTVAELFAKAGTLAGQVVHVRGRVVKFNGGIMGKNWLHLRDGTGDESQKTHDLTVTSDEVASVGQIVLIKGTLRKDKDFGAGYAYSAMLENASITVE